MLSIIIPIYNVGEKIKNLIFSLNRLSQLKINVQIIFINDGSEKNENRIIKTYSKFKYDIFNIKHSGALKARLYGLKKAKFNYIWFVDPDDGIYLDHDIWLNIKNKIKNGDDIIFFNMVEIFNNSTKKIIKTFPSSNIKLKDYIFNIGYRSCSLCDKIFKKEILTNKNYYTNFNGFHEDTLLWFQILPSIRKISYINRELYIYYRFDSSYKLDSAMTIMHKNRIKHLEYMLQVINLILIYYKKNWEFIVKKKFVSKILNHYIISDLYNTRTNFNELYKYHKEKINDLLSKNKLIKKQMFIVKSIYFINYLRFNFLKKIKLCLGCLSLSGGNSI